MLSGCSQAPTSHAYYMNTAAPAELLYGRVSQDAAAHYTHYDDNPVKQVAQIPLATFSLDVDTGSYANVRRFLNGGQLPPPDAVRVEEMVNYFPPDKPVSANTASRESSPFNINYELAPAPWNEQHTLLRLDIAAKEISSSARPPANLVFLIDTSGSMALDQRLPLVKSAIKMLVNDLRPQDHISIVTYAGSSDVLLSAVSGAEKKTIINALNDLNADGSTNGGAGLQMAYQQAEKGFIKGGVNRILLATDGDFNVGIDDPKAIEALVKKERDSGVTLSTLGVGDDNFNEAMMVNIADVGNGNYSYLDSLSEAQKVLNQEMGQTLVTVAKDVKAQIEFNPQQVVEYRQIGYEKRQLRDEDFNNDAVDAGDIGAGKHVTVLFELTLAGQKGSVDALRYAKDPMKATTGKESELLWVKLRYKTPQAENSRLISQPVMAATVQNRFDMASTDMRFLSAVAAYGQKLRGSDTLAKTSWQQIAQWGEQAKGSDPQGYRAEFIRLVGLAEGLSR
ncbi:vWA domain-containing protein [Citrobacter sp. NCU1]